MAMKILIIVAGCLCNVIWAASWGYSGSKGPSNWYKTYSVCNRTRQSPIQLLEKDSTYKSFPAFVFNGYGAASSSKFTLSNNGHTFQMTVNDYTGMTVNAFGKVFRPWQIHFHWGSTDSVGSEHTMKSDSTHLHPSEMHFVHVNTAYDNVSVALTKYDGLMVFGTIMEVDTNGQNNSFVSKLTPYFSNITYGDTTVDMPSFPLSETFFAPKDAYYHYNGSLTTPPCSEAVQWVVFKKEMHLTHKQMEEFRKLLQNKSSNETTEYLSNNYRPVQPRNGRDIFRTFKSSTDSAASLKVSLFAVGLSFVAFIFFNGHI